MIVSTYNLKLFTYMFNMGAREFMKPEKIVKLEKTNIKSKGFMISEENNLKSINVVFCIDISAVCSSQIVFM